MTQDDALLLTKLALVAASILGASLLARRYGHAVSGALAGLPVIVGPIIAILLIDHPAERVRGIAQATLVCQPAMLAHIVVFAHAARRFGWPACLALAITTYVVLAAALPQLALGPAMACLAAGAALVLCTRLLPATGAARDGPIIVPSSELWWRLAAALAIAAAVMWGADHLPATIAGALLAVPIAGSVLPCFTLPRHGPQATARLLAGFVRGQGGFVAFFVALLALLPHVPKAAAFVLAVGAALATPWLSIKLGTAMRARAAA